MLENIYRWFPGWVRVEIESGYPERFLNHATAAGIPLWQVRRLENRVRFSCLAEDYRRLWPFARTACLRMRVRQKHGLPFWRHRYRHRKGLLVGAVLYGLILALLAPRIWVIQVVGNTDTPTEAILAVAEERGVKLGARMDGVDIKGLQITGTNALSGLSFITMNPSGCVARIDVREREQPPAVLDLSQPSDLVAVCDGLILEMEIRSGNPLVMEGEAVTAGTRLVTGRVDTEMGEKKYRSYGAVWAETRRRITVEIPLTYARIVAVGDTVCCPTISLFCWDLPLYSRFALQGETAHWQSRHFLTVDGTTLPLGITTDYYRPLTQITATRTVEQAKKLAVEQLALQEQELFLPDGYEKQTETGRVKDGCYVLTATYLCRENIAAEVPLDGTLSTQTPSNPEKVE